MIGNIVYCVVIGVIIVQLHFCSGRCPAADDKNVININISEFAGTWYAVAASPVRQGVGDYLRFDVEITGTNSYKMNFTGASISKNLTVTWKVDGQKIGNEVYEFWQMDGSPRKHGPFIQKMVAMDSESFCAMIICTDRKPLYRNSFGMVLSRKKTLENSKLVYLKDKIAQYIDRTDIINVENSCCA